MLVCGCHELLPHFASLLWAQFERDRNLLKPSKASETTDHLDILQRRMWAECQIHILDRKFASTEILLLCQGGLKIALHCHFWSRAAWFRNYFGSLIWQTLRSLWMNHEPVSSYSMQFNAAKPVLSSWGSLVLIWSLRLRWGTVVLPCFVDTFSVDLNGIIRGLPATEDTFLLT